MSDTYISTKKCLICNNGLKNNTLYWHNDPDTGDIWCWCNKCSRGYSLYQYCSLAGLTLSEFLKQDFDFQEASSNEVQKMNWPNSFIPLYDPRSEAGVSYIKSRGLDLDTGMFYDSQRNGVVFPYYYGEVFCGAQVRLIEPWVDDAGDERKIDTIPGTRLGLLFYNYDQGVFRTNVKAVVICEGAFNAISIQQSLNASYGGILTNPFKVIACSGSSVTQHHIEVLKDLRDQGFRVIAAPDTDDAGMKMLLKLKNADAITHYALTEEIGVDWNDLLKNNGKDFLSKFFLGKVKSV